MRASSQKALVYLRNQHLISSTGPSDRTPSRLSRSDPETVVAHLWPGIKMDYHGRLASTLEASGGADDEAIAIHFDAAGEQKSAGKYYYKAGEKAAAALAFNHAAGLFQRALDLSTATGEEPGELRRSWPKLWQMPGVVPRRRCCTGRQPSVLEAAIDWSSRDAPRTTSPPAAIYNRGGRPSPAFSIRLGLRLPSRTGGSDPNDLVVPFAADGARPELHATSGIRGSQNRLQRADIAWSAATGLTMADTYSAAALASRGLLLAFKTREPYRIARSLLLEALTRGWAPRERRTAINLIDHARPFVETSGSAYLKGLQELALASFHFSSGNWRKGLAHASEAERVFCVECRSGVVGTGNQPDDRFVLPGSARRCTGVGQTFQGMAGRCAIRGDRYSATTIGVYPEPGRLLAADDHVGALQILEESLAEWSGEAFHVQQMLGFMMRCYIYLDQGRALEAWDLIQKRWPVLQQHHVLRGEMMRISLLEMRMRVAMTAVLENGPAELLLRSVERDAKALEKEQARYALPHSCCGRAWVAEFRGNRAAAIQYLERAVEIYDEVELIPFGEAARRALGILLDGERGRLMVEQADAALRAHGYRNPARHAAVYAPILAVRHQEVK